MKPIFKKSEIVVALPNKDIDLGSGRKETTAKVLYVGAKQENYKVGDTILYVHRDSYDEHAIEYFGQKLLRFENEAWILCAVEE